MESDGLMMDGFGPLPIARPKTVAELGDVVRRASADGQAIYPFGGQTQLDLGNPPTKPGVAVDMRGLDAVIDFPARDMTITVQAGIAVARLQSLLAVENLRLPIDVPSPEQATLGGILATNVSGPRRCGYGTLRDYVIGISAVNDEGNEFKAGGRVVKNVAGYDLCKLLVGSLGTLGIITQVTLKLRPLAEETALVTMASDDAGLAELLNQIHSSRTRPVCVELLNRNAGEAVFSAAALASAAGAWSVIVGYEGNSDAVRWQVNQLVTGPGSRQSLGARVGASAQVLWRALISWRSSAAAEFIFKVNTLPSDVPHTCSEANAPPAPMIQAHAGNGIIYYLWPGAPPFKESYFSNLPAGGNVVALKQPRDWKQQAMMDAWGSPPGDLVLMQAVKRQFDPKGLFNPGRYVGGI